MPQLLWNTEQLEAMANIIRENVLPEQRSTLVNLIQQVREEGC